MSSLVRNKLLVCVGVALLAGTSTVLAMSDVERQEAIQQRSRTWMKWSREAEKLGAAGDIDKAAEKYQAILQDRASLGLKPSSEQSDLARLWAAHARTKPKAESLYKQMISEREKENGADDLSLIYPLTLYADFLAAEKRLAEAKSIRNRVASIQSKERLMPEKEVRDIGENKTTDAQQKADALLKLAQRFVDRDRHSQAIYCFDACLKLAPTNAEALLGRGEALSRFGKDAQAKEDYDAAIKHDPRLAKAYFLRGIWFENKDSLQSALANFNKVIEINPSDIETLGYRAKLFSRLGKNDAAIADYNRAIAVDPERTWPYVQRAGTYLDMKQYDLAFDDFTALVKRFPQSIDYRQFRAEAYVKAGRYADALPDYDALIKMDPEWKAIVEKRAEIAAKAHAAARKSY